MVGAILQEIYQKKGKNSRKIKYPCGSGTSWLPPQSPPEADLAGALVVAVDPRLGSQRTAITELLPQAQQTYPAATAHPG